MTKEHNQTSLRIESILLNAINIHGTEAIARAIGVNRTQISKWKTTHIPKIARFLAYIEYGLEDDEMRVLAKEVASILIKEYRSEDNQ